jgi:hypothetical protein
MIHLQDARPAYSAMMATIRFVLGTPFAVPSIAEPFRLLQSYGDMLHIGME